MAKLGWALCVALLVSVLGMAAARPDDSAKLEEIRAILAENNRLQRIDLHRRSYASHRLFKTCDFGDRCIAYDAVGAIHAVDQHVNPKHHLMTEECTDLTSCKKKEAEWQEILKKRAEK